MEYQGEVLDSIYGEERVRNGVSRRSIGQYLWREESKEWSIKEKYWIVFMERRE